MNLVQKQFIQMIIPVMMIYSLSEWFSADVLTLYCGTVFHAFMYFHLSQNYWDNRRYTSVNVIFCLFYYVWALFTGVMFDAVINDNNISIAVAFTMIVYTNIYFCKGDHTAHRDIENDMKELPVENVMRLLIMNIISILNCVCFFKYDEKYQSIGLLVTLLIVFPMIQCTKRLVLIDELRHADIEQQQIIKEKYIYWTEIIHKFEHMIFDFLKTNLMFYLFAVQGTGKDTNQEPKTLCRDSDYITVLNSYEENKQTIQLANLIKSLMLPYSQLCLLFICAKQELVNCMYMFKILYLTVIARFRTMFRCIKYVLIRVIFISLFLIIVCILMYFIQQKIDSANENIVISDHNLNFWQRRLSTKENGKMIITRHLGEDVELKCFVDKRFEPTLIYDWIKVVTHSKQVYWKHNGTLIDSSTSDRLEVSRYGNLYYLRIKHLEESDFGLYDCHSDIIKTYYLQIPDLQNITKNETFIFEQYVLKMAPRQIKTYYIRRGKILTFFVPLYLFIDTEGDISVNYNVNSVDIHNICIHDIMSCSPTAYLSKHFLEGFSNERLIVEKQDYNGLTKLVIQVQSCVCGQMYGNHEITYYREYYNRSSGTTQVIETIYPLKLMFFPSDNDSIINQDMFENYPGMKLFRILSETDHIKVPFIFASEIRVNCFALGIYSFNLLICVLVCALQKVVSVYCKYTIIPVTNRFLQDHVQLSPLKIKQRSILEIEDSEHDPQYDVYISCCTEDNDFAEVNVLKYVEENHRLRACFPARDLADQAGVEVLHLYAKATRLSKKFIVVLSQQYVDDNECNELQLLRCILPLLREQVRHQHELLIIKLDSVAIPEQIKWDSHITIVDYSSIDDDLNLKHKLLTFLRK